MDVSEEKNAPPEIEHGPDVDKGIDRHARVPPPCSKRLQVGKGGWCLRPQNHEGDCEGVVSETPTGITVRIPHKYP
jgi:hypothetical protein